jgi:hypothetical protein
MKKEELIKFIEKELDYDCAGGEDCPYCGKNITPNNYWIDHKGALAGNINLFLGFRSGSWNDDGTEGMIFRKIDDLPNITGNKKIDSNNIGDNVWELFYS